MNVLHIDSSITGPNSVSRLISAAVMTSLKLANPVMQVVHRDLAAEPIPHLDSQALAGIRPAPGAAGATTAEAARDAAILKEFLAADTVVIGAPMYNFAIPSQLKAWIDRILVAGQTFRYTAEGPQGLAGGKKVIVVSSRGGFYTPDTPSAARDHQESYLRTVFGFIGINDVRFVSAEGIAISPEQRDQAIRTALAAVPAAVAALEPARAA